MPVVDENRLKGNYAAAYVSAKLSEQCLVRPVAADTDVGIDLYCETVSGGRPFLHFWLQVRSGDQCRVDRGGGAARCAFDRKHLEYWSRQPVPVFAALVPVSWPVARDPTVFVVDLTTQLLATTLPRKQRSVHSDYVWRADDRIAVANFLERCVPESVARLQCRSGVISATPTPSPTYEHTVPIVPVAKFSEEILRQIRSTAALGVLYLGNEVSRLDRSGFRKTLSRVLAAFKGDMHWENFAAQAVSSHCDADFQQAIGFYTEAIESIQRDSVVRGLPDWKRRVLNLKRLRARAKRGEATKAGEVIALVP